MSSLNTFLNADDSSKSAVFGYVRQMEQQLLLQHVPIDVKNTCLRFYFDKEFIDKVPEDIILSQNKMTIMRNGTLHCWENISFCKNWIDSLSKCVVIWTMKINSKTYKCNNINNRGICVGIFSNDTQLKLNPLNIKNTRYVHWSKLGTMYVFENRSNHNHQIGNKLTRYNNDGDIISYKLDLINACFHCKINKNPYILLVKNIQRNDNIKYKLGITIGTTINSVTLMDYQCI